jgi:hypothetical protein
MFSKHKLLNSLNQEILFFMLEFEYVLSRSFMSVTKFPFLGDVIFQILSSIVNNLIE